jgi:hypothetical protein
MNMKTTASTPEEYIELLAGWPRDCVQHLRNHVRSSAKLDEEIKWGHLVFSSNGPAILIRAEEDRVLFGFWRGKRLREIEPKLKASGKYEMATIEIRSEPYPANIIIKKLVREAVRLNKELGNPQDAAKK